MTLFPSDLDVHKGATFSSCRRYRYDLWRIWDWDRLRDRVIFVLLNPSTADENQDDPTIRRCVAFAKSWGYGGVNVLNLFAYRCTNPAELATAPDPVGPDNDAYLTRICRSTDAPIVFGWGAHPLASARALQIQRLLFETRPALCLGINKDGSPRHPLYVPGCRFPLRYEPQAASFEKVSQS